MLSWWTETSIYDIAFVAGFRGLSTRLGCLLRSSLFFVDNGVGVGNPGASYFSNFDTRTAKHKIGISITKYSKYIKTWFRLSLLGCVGEQEETGPGAVKLLASSSLGGVLALIALCVVANIGLLGSVSNVDEPSFLGTECRDSVGMAMAMILQSSVDRIGSVWSGKK